MASARETREKNKVTQSVESSGSFPARRRGAIPDPRQALTLNREQTEADPAAEVLKRLADHRAYWYAVIRSKVPELYVEDAYGEACVRITENVAKHDPRRIVNIDAYIRRTCINCAIDQLRRKTAEAETLVKLGSMPETLVDDDAVIASERYLIVREVLADVLTERQHISYVLRHVFKLTSREIGERLEISHALARKDLSAAQKALDKEEVRHRLRTLLHDAR